MISQQEWLGNSIHHEGHEEHEEKKNLPSIGLSRAVQWVIPAWSAGIQANMDVFPEASLRAWIPAIHAGMTVISIFMFFG